MGKKKKKGKEPKQVDDKPKFDTATSISKEFNLCRDKDAPKRSKGDGVAFFQEQLEQAKLDGDKVMIYRLTAIVNRLTGGKRNGLQIEPSRIRKQFK